jgi:hypothetical protein
MNTVYIVTYIYTNNLDEDKKVIDSVYKLMSTAKARKYTLEKELEDNYNMYNIYIEIEKFELI